jgi:UDP-N-acetylglucosamine 2-epimerase (non-hydrolysing)/GDP/UDP-N,N'-diacetylbacillosamine 2-epimerase (hydrolysing)
MFIPSLGQRRYFSALKYVKAVLGNSSSGIIEVPSFGIPTLDIGDRQKGRIAADSVIHCGYSTEEIKEGIEKVVSCKIRNIDNPYYKEGSCDAILKIIKTYPLDNIIQKHFYDIVCEH